MHATSFGFFSVGEEQLKFQGIFYKLAIQLTDVLQTVEPCAVYKNSQPIMILGNDLIGGVNAQFAIVSHAGLQSCYLLQDVALNLDVLTFLKNNEGVGFPPEPKANKAEVGKMRSPVEGLFRRA